MHFIRLLVQSLCYGYDYTFYKYEFQLSISQENLSQNLCSIRTNKASPICQTCIIEQFSVLELKFNKR